MRADDSTPLRVQAATADPYVEAVLRQELHAPVELDLDAAGSRVAAALAAGRRDAWTDLVVLDLDGPAAAALAEPTGDRRPDALAPLLVVGSAPDLRDVGTRLGALEAVHKCPERPEHLRLGVRAAGRLARLARDHAALQDEHRRVQRSRGQFLANMGHEVRTPLNGILGMCELLLDSGLGAEQRQHLGIVQRSAHALAVLFDDILDYSRIESGRLNLDPIEFDLRVTVEGVVEIFQPMALAKDVDLGCLIHSSVPRTVEGDPSRLRQVLSNLIGNAVKFTERGEVVVRIDARARDEEAAQVRFEVIDTGIGIPDGARARLFEAYSQVDDSMSRPHEGSGLGLAISKQLVELMGGRIDYRSTRGRGSRFWFDLPLRTVAGARREVERGELESVRVLVVDEHALGREVACRQLASSGVRVDSVDSGRRALERLRDARREGDAYRVALVDLESPGVDSLALARSIKADAAIADTRVVLGTTSGRRGETREAIEAGVDAYLTKPLDRAKLVECLRQVVALGGAPPRTVITRHSLAETLESSRRRVLLVDDNSVNQKVAARMLEQLGCRVDVANDGVEALAATGTARYDLVLMDCQMPHMDGFAATRSIRDQEAERGLARTPVVALTALAHGQHEERCRRAGMDDFLSKPFTREALEHVLVRWTGDPDDGADDDAGERRDRGAA